MIKKYYKYIITLIFFMFILVLSYNIYTLNLVPIKYFIIINIVLLLIDTIANVCLFLKKKWTKVISIIIYLMLFILSIVGIIYVNKTNNFFANHFSNNENTYQLTYYIMSKNNYNKNELNNKEIAYYAYTVHINEALSEYAKNYTSSMIAKDEINEVMTNDIFLIESATYQMQSEEQSFNYADYNIIYEFTLEFSLDEPEFTEEEPNPSEGDNQSNIPPTSKKNVINVYVGGYDFSNVRMDFNVLITANMDTHELLITNIPRDYYLTIPGKNIKDTLSTMSPYGVTNNIRAIENLLNVKIDYYLTAKTTSLVSLVDSIGGITYCSDMAYTTDHALVIGTYDDSKGKHLNVKKGCQQLNGIETLTVARERKAFKTQDIQRMKNDTAIMKSILSKMKSPNMVMNYPNVLSAVGNMYTTSMPKEIIQNGVKSVLTSNWTVKNQVLTGKTTWGTCGLSGTYKYVMHPTPYIVENAKKKIKEI